MSAPAKLDLKYTVYDRMGESDDDEFSDRVVEFLNAQAAIAGGVLRFDSRFPLPPGDAGDRTR